jgi:S-adenosylmethionine decarboxylase
MDTDIGAKQDALPVLAPESVDRATRGLDDLHLSVIDDDHDFFIEKDGERFAGVHLLVDMWGAGNLDNPLAIEQTLRAAAAAAGATVLSVFHHLFSPNGGVSCIVALAESHISVHTWPERHFAAIDIFMCGACDPYLAVPTLRRFFAPFSLELNEIKRGLLR